MTLDQGLGTSPRALDSRDLEIAGHEFVTFPLEQLNDVDRTKHGEASSKPHATLARPFLTTPRHLRMTSPLLTQALDYVSKAEGGYAERPIEPGGAVNMGIILGVLLVAAARGQAEADLCRFESDDAG